MDLQNINEEKLAEFIIREIKNEIRDLVKKQLKEVAFQLTLFADTMDDDRKSR